MPAPRDILKEHFGFDSFRPNQEQIVDALLSGRDCVAVMPTGAGKSVCYQVPALALGGYTIVVSPLISLMKDQVQALGEAGIAAAFVNSSQTPARQRDVLEGAAAGRYTLLYVAPERLDAPSFLELAASCPPALVAVDEAHCVSQWGQDFRPSYLGIRDFIEALPVRPAIGAFTATATREVRDDIAGILGLRDPLAVVASFDRPNLHFSVKRPTQSSGPRSKDGMLTSFLRQHRGTSGIVYCSTRKAVDEVCQMLLDQGVPASKYHAGLARETRERNQEDFVYDRALVMVATNAFGMGIDKSNVGFVVHYNLPLDVESYYQEAGRAGRDGSPAECLLLYQPRDVRTAEFLLSNGYQENRDIDAPTKAQLLARAKERLKQMTFYATTQDCLRGFLLRYFGEDAPGYCGACGNCETQFEEQDVTVEAQKVVSCVYRLQQRGRAVGKSTIVGILRGSKADKVVNGGYATLSTYGIMANVSARRVRFVLDSLVERGYLSVSTGEYPVVEPTSRSAAFLKDGERYVIKVPREDALERDRKRLRGSGSSGSGTADAPAGDPVDQALFQQLKELRAAIAAEEGVPAYIVFSNRTLAAMCQMRPTTEQGMLEVPGVGQFKFDKYGQRFLDRLQEDRASPAPASL